MVWSFNTRPIEEKAIEPIESYPEEIEEIEVEENQIEELPGPVTPLEYDLENQIRELAISYGIAPEIVFGLIEQESRFNPYVISEGGDYGLMQINRVNHEWLKAELHIDDVLEPHNNVTAGMYILGDLKRKYGTDHSMLMAYNMGEAGAKTLWSRGIYTSEYSRSVIEKSENYR